MYLSPGQPLCFYLANPLFILVWTAIVLHCSYMFSLLLLFKLLSHVQLFASPWEGFPVLHCLPEFESMMPSNHLILCLPLLLLPSIFPSIRVFLTSQLFTLGGQSIGASASASVFPMNIHFPLGLTGLISLQSRALSRVLSSTTIQKHQFFGI